MNAAKLAGLCISLLVAISACAGNALDKMKRFRDQRDQDVAQQENINRFLLPRLLIVVRDVQEVRPGVMEYSFEPKYSWSEEVKCKFILVVAKDTGTIIGWRYNGKPENCQ